MIKQILLSTTVLALAACGSAEKRGGSQINIPDWVSAPQYDGGIAETSCVQFSGHFDLDKKEAVAKARDALAKQIEVKVKTMDKIHSSKTQVTAGTNVGGVFESVSRQVTQQSLVGARPHKVNLVKIGQVENLCAMVVIDPKETKNLFSKLVSASGAQLSSKDEDVLYQEFKAYKAHQELQDEFSR